MFPLILFLSEKNGSLRHIPDHSQEHHTTSSSTSPSTARGLYNKDSSSPSILMTLKIQMNGSVVRKEEFQCIIKGEYYIIDSSWWENLGQTHVMA